ncbi:MAG TPA: hypothetical protein PKY31_13095 [Spirochaetota bacterium]|nr:hypothetical protein [Spirochaetota bacterium]
MIEYVHLPPGDTVVTGFGDYRIVREGRVTAEGSEYFFVVADAPVGSACVGAGTLRFIHVRGRVVAWHARADEFGNPVSLLEPVTGDDAMDGIRRFLATCHSSLQVCF